MLLLVAAAVVVALVVVLVNFVTTDWDMSQICKENDKLIIDLF